MYRISFFLGVIGRSCVVLSICLFLVNNVITPVDGTSPSKDDDASKTYEKVLPQEKPKSTTVSTATANISDDSSLDASTDKTQKNGVSAADNTTVSFRGSPAWFSSIKSGALERTGFVALGIMSIILFFFVIRAIRIRRKKSKSRKYGVITSTASDMEMEPLDRGDEDEEETTLFDAQHHKYSLK